jgi:hypothetical protein
VSETQTETGRKYRPGSVVQNGIRRPSDPEGACGVIWAELDYRRDMDKTIDLATLKEIGTERGWKVGNIMSEFYNWRRFNGVKSTPRVKKEAKAKTPRKARSKAKAQSDASQSDTNQPDANQPDTNA